MVDDIPDPSDFPFNYNCYFFGPLQQGFRRLLAVVEARNYHEATQRCRERLGELLFFAPATDHMGGPWEPEPSSRWYGGFCVDVELKGLDVPIDRAQLVLTHADQTRLAARYALHLSPERVLELTAEECSAVIEKCRDAFHRALYDYLQRLPRKEQISVLNKVGRRVTQGHYDGYESA